MRPQKRSHFSRGVLIIFYVSGNKGGRKEAVGIGRITFYGTLSTTEAMLKLSRQGVLEKIELDGIAGPKGVVSVFTFDNFLMFDRPIPYRRLKEMGCIGGANLVTAQPLAGDALGRIVAEGFPRGC